MDDGLRLHARWLKIFDEKDVARFQEKFGAAKTAESDYAVARSRQCDAARRQETADAAQTEWLGKARLIFILRKGARWSEAWAETGFTHRSTSVPKRGVARTALCGAVVQFFTRRADYEYAFANVTAEAGAAIHAEMLAASHASLTAQAEARAQRQARDAAERELRRAMRLVRVFLAFTFTTDDVRWASFGLNQPTSTRSALEPRSVSAPSLAEVIALPPRTEIAAEFAPTQAVA